MHALEDLVANQRADAMSRIVSLEERHQDDYDAQLSWRTLAAWMVNRSKGVEERIHFVARTLLTGTLDDQRIILATPLYVAAGSAPRTK
jgi:hypothetical protein